MTGSIHVRKGFWHMQFRFKEGTDWKQKWKSTGLPEKGNKRKAEKILADALSEHKANGGYREPSNILFCDFVRDWVDMNKSRLQATTLMGYDAILTKHVYPYFYAKRLLLNDITPLEIQGYYTAKLDEGLNPNTIIKHHAVMRSALQYAVKTKLMKDNPCDFTDKPKRKKYIGEFYNADEIKRLLDASKGTTVEIPIFLAAYFGLRRSDAYVKHKTKNINKLSQRFLTIV